MNVNDARNDGSSAALQDAINARVTHVSEGLRGGGPSDPFEERHRLEAATEIGTVPGIVRAPDPLSRGSGEHASQRRLGRPAWPRIRAVRDIQRKSPIERLRAARGATAGEVLTHHAMSGFRRVRIGVSRALALFRRSR